MGSCCSFPTPEQEELQKYCFHAFRDYEMHCITKEWKEPTNADKLEAILAKVHPEQWPALLDFVYPSKRTGLQPNVIHLVERNQPVLLDALLAAGANINVVNSFGESPMYRAVYCDYHNDVLEVLVKYHASPHAYDKDGFSCLHRAIAKKSIVHTFTDTVRLILSAGANPNQSTVLSVNGKNVEDGRTPLHVLMENTNQPSTLDVIKMLVANGADVNATTSMSIYDTIYTDENFHMKNHPGDIEYSMRAGVTPLHIAVAQDVDFEIVELLVKLGADPRIKNKPVPSKHKKNQSQPMDCETPMDVTEYAEKKHLMRKFGNFLTGEAVTIIEALEAEKKEHAASVSAANVQISMFENYKGATNGAGQPHGFGTQIYSDGGRYTGNWFKGYRHGEGTMEYANRHRYTGSWRNDKRDGMGTLADEKCKTLHRGKWFEDKESDQMHW